MENQPPSRRRASRAPYQRTGRQRDADMKQDALRQLPVLPVKNAVIMPHTVMPLFVDAESSIAACDAAVNRGTTIMLVTQRDESVANPQPGDLYGVGVEAVLDKVQPIAEIRTISVIVRTLRRTRILQYTQVEPFLMAEVVTIENEQDDSLEVTARARIVRHLCEQAFRSHPRVPEEMLTNILHMTDPNMLIDAIAMALDMPVARKQELLEITSVLTRLEKIDELLRREIQLVEMEGKIQEKMQIDMERGQREYYLREHLRMIQRELADADPASRENLDMRTRIKESGMPEEVQARAVRELERLESMPTMAPEHTILRSYIDWLVTIPWKQETPDQIDLPNVAKVLDEHHFGLPKVKERLLEFMAVRKLAPSSRSPILCLVGPPGVGKTSLGRSIAEAIGRKYVRVSLGGVRDEAEIRGHRRTYIGALPGRIIQTMKQAGTINPVFVLDEIDKLASYYRGDPASALLEVLDPEQNHTFSDHYLEVPYSLSRVMFILTANSLDPIAPALRDRMEIIELPSYTEEEKVAIATRFLIQRQVSDCGLTPKQIDIREDAVRRIIRDYAHEAGVRNLERELGALSRKVARKVAEKQSGRIARAVITAEQVPSYLGPPRGFLQEKNERDEVGVATGVAWTPTGGDLIPIEVAILKGKGQITLTGSLGDVLRESAQNAISYTRAQARDLGIAPNFHEQNDVHIHLAMGAVPKDGPSAGVPITVALISALTGRPVYHDLAMTGEISLRGLVLPVGGIKEKVLAAHRAKLQRFALPRKNMVDLEDVPPEVHATLKIIPVDTLHDVVALALHPSIASRSDAPMGQNTAQEKPGQITGKLIDPNTQPFIGIS